MDNKIIVELVVKNLEEIKLLVDTLQNEENADPLLIALTATKAKTLYQELMLLSQSQPVLFQNDLNVTPEEIPTAEEEIPDAVLPNGSKEDEVQPSSENETDTIETQEMILVEPETVISVTQPLEEPESEISENILPEVETVAIISQPSEGIIVAEEVVIEEIQQTVIHLTQESEEPEPESSENSQPETETVPPIPQPTEELIVADEITIEEIQQEEEKWDDKIEESKNETLEKKINGEQFISELSVNEKLAATTTHGTTVKGLPVTNLMNAIGLNDRFLFTRELFANDNKSFENTVNQLDQLKSFLEAIDFLEGNFKWTKNEASLKFMDLVKRRFEN